MTIRWFATALAGSMLAALAAPVAAQLCQSQVLVVYDSRIDDSRLIAEHYAGSANVPSGNGGVLGAHPGVKVVDLSTLPGAGVPPYGNTIAHTVFEQNFRTPLRTYLTGTSFHGTPLSRIVRCIVLTKGIPHRLLDTDAADAADQPAIALGEFSNRDATFSSFDSELTLLYQNTETGEVGGAGDSKLDGTIVNPYYQEPNAINTYSNANNTSAKTITSFFGPANSGYVWQSTTSGPAANQLLPGDVVLVCRLDGPSDAAGDTRRVIYDTIDRAQHFVYDIDNASIILDESGSDGLVLPSGSDAELDNDSLDTGNTIFGGDDYEQTRDILLSDARWNAAKVRYNALSGASEFLVGPLVSYGSGQLVTGDVAYVASYGANHNGIPAGAGTTYATSFQLAPGAVFNTIESYNGRAFGGLGQNGVPQQQASDFLKAGGTFAIGTVWEPLSFTAADNRFIVGKFVLGTLCWGEAAWNAIPVLSWQHIVLGDPLATATLSNFDVNTDHSVNVEDLYAYETSSTDVNRSGSVTQADFDALYAQVRKTNCETCDMVRGRR